ncbi:SGNH/GDSL hydrolase family protein [Roseomonas sp. JC162]|uniref:SGNH/GDSL hydrolase family protein n=1 Tax=Neoroseomonas marina TaxID=1232220 RepID=A0A848EKQ7_9PROT|nr:SGNH/GDSL hydrolase family protein [Neoroseomonas marina]NMJ44482.1 SGNH/GDSL hydrolase family protein [Neoroseomonas marina]
MIQRRFMAALGGLVLGLAGRPADASTEACPAVPMPALWVPSFAAAVARGGAVKIVAFGSSSTAGAGATLPWRSYPAVLERQLRRALPGLAITVMNRGAGGEDAVQMIGRIESDVLADSPDLVIWQLGANATLRGLDPGTFRRLLLQGLERFRQARVDVVLMDNQRAPRIAAQPNNGVYDAILAEAAATQPGVTLFRRGALMDSLATRGVSHAALLVSDGLHHNDRGYACLAEALGRGLVEGLAVGTLRARR